jgi:hypothetical protein
MSDFFFECWFSLQPLPRFVQLKCLVDSINAMHIVFGSEPANDQVSLKLVHFQHLPLVCVSAQIVLHRVPRVREDIRNGAS